MILKSAVSHALPRLFLFTVCSAAALFLGACAAWKKQPTPKAETSEHVNNTTKFSSKDFGVKGSPRITTAKAVRKGGGRYKVGEPYSIRGKKYYPKDDQNLNQTGMASWYGPNFHGRLTANGEIYDQYSLSAAHPTLPLPSYAKVTNLENGRSLIVRVNDRGPYAHGRVIDLSAQAAKLLDYTNKGVTKVRVQYHGKARMDGLDEDFLMASYQGPGNARDQMPGIVPATSTPGTLIAMAEMPQMLVTATPSEAISQNFTRDQGFRVPLSSVPIPTARPVLFEETSTPTGLVYRAVRKPLAYAENSGDGPSVLQFAAFARNYETKFSYLGDNPDGTVKMELGRIEDQFSMQFLANLFKSAGNLNLADEYNLAVLTTNEYYANAVLAFAREIGLLQVKIR